MELTLAKLEDLNDIKDMYTKIVKNMYDNNITIWNEYYPNEVFESDIEKERLYLLKNDNEIVGAFVIEDYEEKEGILWEDENFSSCLLTRLGVNVKYLHQGIGKKLIEEAILVARSKNVKYLRLLVSEVNTPAINLYFKCGFKKRDGIYKEVIREDFSLCEYGFEMLL